MLREGGMAEPEAAKMLKDNLYDYRQGITDLEMDTVGKYWAYWSWRGNQLRQLGRALVEPITNPYLTPGKALAGQSSLGRLERAGSLTNWVPDVINDTLPDDIDEEAAAFDNAMDKMYGPFFSQSKTWLANRKIGEATANWYKEHLGKDITHESLVFNAMSFREMLRQIAWMAQMGAVLSGPKNTTNKPVHEIFGDSTAAIMDGSLPIIDGILTGAVDGATQALLNREVERYRARTHSMSQAEAAAHYRFIGLLRAAGMDDFIVYEQGQPRIDEGVYGMMWNFLSSYAPVAAAFKHYAAIDNPRMDQDPVLGTLEALIRESGAVSIYGTNPEKNREYEESAKERKHKDLIYKENRQLK
jgi:hypothetical protein